QVQETDDDDTWLYDTADSTGSFTDNNFYVTDADGGVKFLLTATGQSSGLTAQYRFADAVTTIVVGTQSPDPVAGGSATTATFPIMITDTGTHTITLGVTGLTSG